MTAGRRLDSFLARHARIGLDTAPLIYHLEGDRRYVDATTRLFTWLQGPGASAVTSTLTLTELLVQPYRLKDPERIKLAFAVTALFKRLDWVPPTIPIADRAARLRAEHRLRTPDAIQLATAAVSGATGFVTNDLGFRKIDELEILLLDDLLHP